MLKSISKIIIFLLLLLGGYYLFFLKPKLELPSKLLRTEQVLSTHHSTLTQNRLAFVELTKLDPEASGFNLEKSNLVGTLQKTHEEALEELEKEKDIPEVDRQLTMRFPNLFSETKQIYERQKALLNKVYETTSYEEGVEILTSDEAVEILTDQTNLILEYQFFLDKINEKQEELNVSKDNNQ